MPFWDIGGRVGRRGECLPVWKQLPGIFTGRNHPSVERFIPEDWRFVSKAGEMGRGIFVVFVAHDVKSMGHRAAPHWAGLRVNSSDKDYRFSLSVGYSASGDRRKSLETGHIVALIHHAG